MTIIEAAEAVTEWARCYERMWDMADGFHGSLTHDEAFAQANLLRAADRPDLAAILLREWSILEQESGDLDDSKREQLAALVAELPAIPDHRNTGDFDWSPYITPEESDHESGI